MNNLVKHLTSNNILAEKKLIGWMAFKGKFIDIPPSYIYSNKIRNFYEAIKTQKLRSDQVDLELLTDHSETYYECLDVETPSDPKFIINELEKHHKIRQFAILFNESMDNLSEGVSVDDVLLESSSSISKLFTQSDVIEDYNHEQSVCEYILGVKAKMDKTGALKGIRSGLGKLDEIINGWQHGCVYLVSGLEKLGKSRFVRGVTSRWLNEGLGGIFFMLEEDSDAIHECILSNRARVDTDVIGTQRIEPKQLADLCVEANKYKNQNLYISNKSAITAEYIKATVSQVKAKFARIGGTLDFVVVDYVQRLDDPAGSLSEKADKLAAKLADLTRDEKFIMIEISQLVAGAEKSKAPVHTQLRFGKPYKEAASCIISFDDPERMGEDIKNQDNGKVIKAHILQRKGKGNKEFKLFAELQYSTFYPLEKEPDSWI